MKKIIWILLVIVIIVGGAILVKKYNSPKMVNDNSQNQLSQMNGNQNTDEPGQVATTSTSAQTNHVPLGNDGDSPSLFERNYVIDSVNDKRVATDTNYTVSFKDGRVSAKICNSMSGDFQLSKTTITSENMISTEMYCEGKMDVEDDFKKLFSGDGATFSYDNGILTLTNQSEGVMITLQETD